MIWLQKTLGGSVTLEGTGLHTGNPAVMTLSPAPANSGIVFEVPGADGDVLIPALVENTVDRSEMNRATTLEKDGVRITTVEHILAALHGMGVTNCRIRLEGGEPPISGCASALVYVDLINEAGVVDQGLPALTYRITRPRRWREDRVEISVEPAESFIVSFHIDYEDAAIGIQDATFEILPGVFQEEIAPARTFALMKDVAALQDMGLVKGGSLGNALVFDGGKLVGGQELRFPDEFVRHKILDILGDLYLLGYPVRGRVEAKFTGHSDNIALLRTITGREPAR